MFPLTLWISALDATLEMGKLAVETAEMAFASHSVINARSEIIKTAVRSPRSGNYVELGSLLPEKVLGFSQAWFLAWQDLWKLQGDLLRFWVSVPGLFGQHPSASARRGQALKEGGSLIRQGLAIPGRAIAPLHSKVTSNARRLASPKGRRQGPRQRRRATSPRES